MRRRRVSAEREGEGKGPMAGRSWAMGKGRGGYHGLLSLYQSMA